MADGRITDCVERGDYVQWVTGYSEPRHDFTGEADERLIGEARSLFAETPLESPTPYLQSRAIGVAD